MKFRDILEMTEEKRDVDRMGRKQETVGSGISGQGDGVKGDLGKEESISEHEYFWRLEELKLVQVKNQRAFPRVETNLNAVIVPMERFGVGDIAARVLNISAGGAGVGMKWQCCKGDKFLLKVRLLPEEETWNLFCQVVRIEERGVAGFLYGCQFIELGENERERLKECVSELGFRMR